MDLKTWWPPFCKYLQANAIMNEDRNFHFFSFKRTNKQINIIKTPLEFEKYRRRLKHHEIGNYVSSFCDVCHFLNFRKSWSFNRIKSWKQKKYWRGRYQELFEKSNKVITIHCSNFHFSDSYLQISIVSVSNTSLYLRDIINHKGIHLMLSLIFWLTKKYGTKVDEYWIPFIRIMRIRTDTLCDPFF